MTRPAFKLVACATSLNLLLTIPSFAQALTVTVDGTTVTFNDDRSTFSGTSSFADAVETSNSTFSGTIAPDGTVSGTFSGTGTLADGSGGTIALTDSGGIFGTIDPDGNYNVNWTGNEPDSATGSIPGFRISSLFGATAPTGGAATQGHRDSDKPLVIVDTGDRVIANGIVTNIRAVEQECQRLAPALRVDCLSQGLRMTAERMPKSGRFGFMRREILKASDKLAAIVRRDGDRSVARHNVPRGANPRFALKRSYVPIRPERLASALAEAATIIAELETTLMRASSAAITRANHYQRVAVAVGSVKVLLRS